MPDWITPFKHSIARITHANGAVVGAGFLVSDRHLLSCAHVVTAALALPTNTQAPPTASINLSFPLRQDNQRYTASVVLWQPVSPGHREEDIAVLELSTMQSGKAIALVETREFWEHPIRTFGFPRGHEEGIWATGTLRDERGNGWVQMDSLAYQDRPIEPGFSGAPIWDEQVQGVVGMAVAAEKQRQDVSAAYLIPSSILRSVWDGFTVVSAPAPAGAIAPSAVVPLQLNGSQRKELREALIQAFPQPGSLAAMLEDELELQLNVIAGGVTYEEVIFNLVKEMNARNQIEVLLKGALQANPTNAKLQELAAAWLQVNR